MAMTIVIVDDIPLNALLIKNYVRKLDGVEPPVTFSDPVAALAWCGERLPDVVLVDLQMPEMDGIEFVARLRALPNAGSVAVLVVTGQEDAGLLAGALAAGADDFLRKPIEELELSARVKVMMRLRRLQSGFDFAK
ncbi:hypothetical protein WCLP8_4180010 [uncultured Gammaproteobacteria bacterium]